MITAFADDCDWVFRYFSFFVDYIARDSENTKWFMTKIGALNFIFLIVFVVVTVINMYNYFSFAQVFFYLVLNSNIECIKS